MKYETQSCLILVLITISFFTLTNSLCDNTICDCQNSVCNYCLANEFYYNATAKDCKLCPPECRTCNSNQQCLTCRDMYFLSSKSCLQCPKYCRTCTNQSTCTQSKNGYILINSVCQKCQVSNVETCESLMTVKTCLPGYWKNGDSCSSCREFCSFCTSSNNCLQCQPGYMIMVSAGTYCVACPSGCKTCGDTATCTQCFWNWRLINNTCISISSNCSSISNCQSCEFTNNTVKCVVCNYPFYLSANNTCIQGSSLLCEYASGQNPYQCINQCSALAYSSSTVLSSSKNTNQIICLPRIWVESTMIEQVYFNALYHSRFQNNFQPYNPSVIICGGINEYLYSNTFLNQLNTLRLIYTFKPYYKLTLFIKYVPIFKEILPTNMGVNISVRMSDNATNTFSSLNVINSSKLSTCQEEYMTISSRNVKDQQVTVAFSSQLNLSFYNDTQLAAMFPFGLVGYRQILIQVYRCDSKCRICSNAKYCLECYGNLFLNNYLCVQNCNGMFQFYLPDGDYVNFKSKYCLQQCYSGYYSTLHPLKNNTYICLKCPIQCRTCKSTTECLSCNSPYLFFSANFSCITSCPNTHYPLLRTLECRPCNAPCRTCTNETNCLSCSIGYFNGSNCVGSCPQGTYSSESLRQCLACDIKCSACQNTPTFCTSCKPPYKLLGTACLDTCPLNTHYPSNNTCLPCKSPCLLCQSQSFCITCSRGFLLNNTCLTDCPLGYYKDMGNSRCNLCENNCLTCLSASICRSCINGTFLYNSMCLSQCPIKTYTSQSKICIPCIPPCLTCRNDTSCITCSIGFLSQLNPNTCVTQCQDGYYGQSTNQTCMKCSNNCKTCNQQPTFCITCNAGMLLQNNLCVSKCSAGYFAFNNQKCRPCSYPCKTCIEISSKCLTCVDPFILISENKCSLQCLSTQYKLNGSCQNCVNPCSSCTDAKSCLTCAKNATSPKFLLDTRCVDKCPSGMYGDSVSLKCKNCVFPCQQCLSSSQCLSCMSGYLNVAKKTCQVCSSTYYPDQATKTCQLCSSAISNCLQCQSSTICKVCFDQFYLLNDKCVSLSQCQQTDGYYVNQQLKRCSQCIPPCHNCLNASFCLSCANGYLFQGRCPFTCPSRYFTNLIGKQCKLCNSTICRTCSNSENQCTSCNVNSTFPVFLVENKTCISPEQCLDSYFLDNLFGYTRCLKCISPCKTCLNASYCLSCTSGVLYQGSCSFSCPNKFYADQTVISGVVTCEQCSNICLQCSQNGTNCISCPITKLLENNSCVDKCSTGYYLNQYILQCFQCQSPCLECQSANYCNSCQDPQKILYYGQCIDQCPEGTFVKNKQCLQCPKQCQLCSYSNETQGPICDKCSANLFMNSTRYGVCEKNCKLNEYGDTQTRKCYPCQVPCSECFTATKCKSCIQGYLIYKGQCFKGSQCLDGTFMDPLKAECLDLCYQPYYGDSLTKRCATECTQKRLKVPLSENRICASICPQGFYVDQVQKCTKCGQNSYDCSNILSYDIYTKSIFNRLYVKVKFSKEVLTHLITEQNIKLRISSLSSSTQQYSQRRLYQLKLPSQLRFLQSTIQQNQKVKNTQTLYTFTITERSTRALWLQINTFETLKNVEVSVEFDSYYILSPTPNQRSPGSNLQHLNASILFSRFDQYTLEQQAQGKPYETYSMVLGIVLFVVIIVSIIGNFLSLFYPLIDYFQILFMILFLQIDYPPDLNYFLYGFRYSHYLFLPQIFSTSPENRQQYSQTPGKFGIIVPDADFLTNTGHDFLIIFVSVGIVMAIKLVDFLMSSHIKNNKVTNDPSLGTHNQNKHRITHQKDDMISQHSYENNSHSHSHGQQQKKQYSISIDKNEHLQQMSEHITQEYSQTHNQQQQQQYIPTHNRIQQQILNGNHGRIAKYSKIFMSRLKWNYFNDVCYCVYFYIALFSYSQYYIITEARFISSLFAILGFLFTLALPAFFGYLIYSYRQVIEIQGSKHKVYLPFKTFYYFTIPDSGYSLYQIPIRYIRKLLIAILLVYCSQFPQFVLGIVMMFSLLNIIMTFIYKPFILKFEIYIQSLIELIFLIVIFSVCLLDLEYLDLDTANKLKISQTVVGFTIVLTIVLVLWNLVRFMVELIKQICQKDYFKDYYKQPDILSSQQKSKKDSSIAFDYKENQRHNNEIHQQSNVRLHEIHALSSNDKHQISSFGQGSEQFSGLDIYLKKESDAPPMLIKCIKKFSQESKSSQDEEQKDQKQQQEDHYKSENEHNEITEKISVNSDEKNQIKKKIQFVGFSIGKEGLTESEKEQKEQQVENETNKEMKVQDNKRTSFQNLELQSVIKVNPSVEGKQNNIFQHNDQEDDNQMERQQSQKDAYPYQQQQDNQNKANKQQQDPKNEQYHPARDIQQIFEINRNRDKNKMKTIIEVEDFDYAQSHQEKESQVEQQFAISQQADYQEEDQQQQKTSNLQKQNQVKESFVNKIGREQIKKSQSLQISSDIDQKEQQKE